MLPESRHFCDSQFYCKPDASREFLENREDERERDGETPRGYVT
jgi:hypothetical protein